MIDGSTRVFAILGDPVAHSLSPTMHNAAFQALGLAAAYVPLRCAVQDVPQLMRALAMAGGGGNVTVPHKEVAARSVDGPSARVRLLGACNTFWADDGAVCGDNTDVAGVAAALDALEPPEGPWLILGTGGGARAAADAARDRGTAVSVVSRSADRKQRFEGWVRGVGIDQAPAAECTVVINATPLGLAQTDPLPIDQPPPRAVVAFDMVYAPGETSWVRAMRAAGLRASDGRTMLVAQGAAAFRCWFSGKHPPLDVMRAAVDAALR
ncbi:MAG: shikimate dehydrogenase [Gemmatimonadales bacterium]